MYNNFSSKKTKKVISALLASALVVTSAPITANAATAKVLGVGKTFTVKKTTKVSGLSKAEKKIVKVTVNKKKRTVTVKGVKAGKATFKIGKKAYTVKVGATKIAKKTLKTTMTAGTSQTVSVTATAGKGDTIKFASSNKAVLTVNKASAKASTKGIAKMGVKAVKEGTAKLTVSSKNTGVKKAFTIKVQAAAPAPTQAPSVATTPAITTPSATPGVATTPAVKATATASTTATPGTDATATPGADVTATPGTDATATPGTDATQAPGTDGTQSPDVTQAPDVPVAETGTIKVTTNVTEAAIKVISGTSVIKETTTDGTTKSATFADLANGTYTIEVSKAGYATYTTTQVVAGDTNTVDVELNVAKAVSAKATSETKIQVKFNAEIDEVATTNFKVEGVTVKNATLSADKKTVTIETSTMSKGENYTIKTTGLKSNDVAIQDAEFTFEAKEIQYELKLAFANDKTSLISNGQDTVLVTATIYDEDGEIVSDLDKVEVQFSTTAGSFAEKKVTVQNGIATNMLTSETATSEIKALVSATVVSASNTNLLNLNTNRTVIMTPSVNSGENETVGASLVDIAVETTDRIVLYFNKEVNVEDYTMQDTTTTRTGTTEKNVYSYCDKKLELIIDDKAVNDDTEPSGATERNVLALAKVPDNPSALYAILDVSGTTSKDVPLTDNSNLIVKAIDKTKTVPVSKSAKTVVSDIRVPSILGVENDGLRKIKVTFSEPVQNTTGATQVGSTTYVADDESHWVLDGTPLTSPKWGDATPATAKVGDFNVETGDDTRNVVTITLGTKDDNSQIYFASGSHSVQGNKIGDWANLTDTKNNIINTQTLDFAIDPDESVPTAEVTVESPEQYCLSFNKAVDPTAVANNVILQNYNTTSASWTDLFSVANGGIDVTPVKTDSDGLAKDYIVEVTKDWTYTLNTSSTHENYYNNNYRLHIAKDTITNLSNGLKNIEQNLALNDEIMTTPDTVSPEIIVDGVEQIGTTNSYTIKMSEPVQIPNVTAGGETITASQTQSNNAAVPNNNGVPRVTVTFISEDNSKTVPATITSMADAHDTSFVVAPSETLTAGKWRVIVASISDDIGNTSATLTVKDFEVKTVTQTVDTNFYALWAVAVPNGQVDPIINNSPSSDDIIYVKFNKQFKTFGGSSNAVSTTNYTVNGKELVAESKIDVSLANYNVVANTKNGYTDLVAIHLTPGTLNSGATESNTVTISSTIEAITGGTLANYGMKVLDYVPSIGNSAGNKQHGDYYAWNFKSKDYTSITTATTIKASDVLSLLSNTAYVSYDFKATQNGQSLTISDAAKTDLKITHAGDYDFTGQTFKSLTIETNETGLINITGGTFGEVNVTAPNADVTLDTIATVTNVGGTTTTGKVNVKDVMSASLTLKDVNFAGDIVVTDNNNGCRIVTTGTNNFNSKKLSIETTGNVILDANDADVVVTKAATVKFESAPASLTLDASAVGVTLETISDTLSTSVAALITSSNNTGKTVTVETSAKVTLSGALTQTGYTFYKDSSCAAGTELTTADLTLNSKTATTVYAKETATGAIATLSLKASSSTTVAASITAIAQGESGPDTPTAYTIGASNVSVTQDGEVTISLNA